MILGHVMGFPLEETAAAAAPLGVVLGSALALSARLRLRRIREQLWRR